MMTIDELVTQAIETGILTQRQEVLINALLRMGQYNELDMEALEQLTEALLEGKVISEKVEPNVKKAAS